MTASSAGNLVLQVVALLAYTAAHVACREFPAGPTIATPVIELTIIVDDSFHIATIAEAARADRPIPSHLLGIAPARVDLSVTDDLAQEHPLVPRDSAGIYVVTLQARGGAKYRLHGFVDGRPVLAETITPLAFVVLAPASDTITEANGTVTDLLLRVPYSFAGDGVAGFEYRVSALDGSLEMAGRLHAATGDLVFLRDPEVRRVALIGYNEDATAWLISDTPRGNIAGAFGGFGGAIVSRRMIRAP